MNIDCHYIQIYMTFFSRFLVNIIRVVLLSATETRKTWITQAVMSANQVKCQLETLWQREKLHLIHLTYTDMLITTTD